MAGPNKGMVRMKREIGIEQPEYLNEDWPGKYEVFSWLEYIITVPNPVFLVTTRKANGLPNANLNAWGMLIGGKGEYSSLMALLNNSHTYENILREGEWGIGFPSFPQYRQCFETIRLNGPENDEISDAGFTLETPRTIRAPRIAECLINLECRLAWHRPLYDNSRWHLFAGRVTRLAMDESAMTPDPAERIRILELMYNVRSTVHPLTGEQYALNTLGLLNRVEDIFGKKPSDNPQ
jgi:flavin reductase (DIM6/NTAB) family NADH-FMN oxidoreductase RutF